MPRLTPPQIFGACLIGLLVTHFALSGLRLPPFGVVALGLGLCALGGWISSLGARRFLAAGTTIRPGETPTVLVRDGIYRFTRNPMYLGLVIILCGLTLALNCLVCAVFPVLFVIAISRLVLPGEERRMAEIFGAAYGDYRRQVRRWL